MRRHLLTFIVAVLILLTLSRLGLSYWQWDRVDAAGGLWPVLFGGLRIDVSLLAMVVVFPALLSPWLGHSAVATRASAYWFRTWWLLFVLLEVATPQFISEYDSRPNRLFFEYLTSPREVSAMLWEGYRGVLFAAAALLVLATWAAVRLFPTTGPDPSTPGWQRPLISAVLLVVLGLAGRGTLDHRPINPSMVAFSSDAMVNALALNSLYNVIEAARRMQDERSAEALYGKMPVDEMNRVVRAAIGLHGKPINATYPSLHPQTATFRRDQPVNLVIIVEESLGAQYVGRTPSITPEIERLLGKAWNFNRAYATGTRSVRGLEAIATGFLPTPAEAVLKLPRSQSGFFSIAQLLGQHGYHSRFLYGGEAHFDNMRGFFLGNGFKEVVDRSDFVSPVFVGTWGASDEDMFNQLDRLLREDGSRPTVTLAFSVSNHTPWEFPDGRIAVDGEPGAEDAVRYADWALGRFFDKAQRAPYWKNTIFLVIADHDSRVTGASLVPVERFHIPAFIIGAAVPPRQDDRLVSQIDMAPTLLSLMGLDTVHPMLGADLTGDARGRALMQYGDNFGYLKGDSLIVLEPHRPAHQYRYRPAQGGKAEQFEPVTVDPALAHEALAHALWPSWAYREERYRLPAR